MQGRLEVQAKAKPSDGRVLDASGGGLRAPEEAWDDLLLEAFPCQVWSFSVCLGCVLVLQEVSSCVQGGLRRLQNGGLRALEED